MAVAINGSGPITGLTSIDSPTTINGLTIPTTGFGKVLQVVRATDSTQRSTTSTSYVDASLSVTITPQKNDSAVMIIANGYSSSSWTTQDAQAGALRITDSSNNAISGAEEMVLGGYEVGRRTTNQAQLDNNFNVVAYATPATTSAVTYKLRFRMITGTGFTLRNSINTAQLYAIEVSA